VLPEAVRFLRCPICSGSLHPAGRTLRCEPGHSFDLARQAYVNLLPGSARSGAGDSPAMVAARAAFLGTDHYSPLADAAAAECSRAAAGRGSGLIVDIGAGTGYYLARALDRLPGWAGLALDASKYALRRAARAHERLGAVGCDLWGSLPVRTAVAGVVLNVFAPRNPAEIARILRPDGALVVVTPTGRHLAELVSALDLLSVNERKDERLEEQLAPAFTRVNESAWERRMSLFSAEVEALVAMGPSARHLDEATTRARVGELPEPMCVTASVVLRTYRPA
jgi:23S rRNA (guanine745-N1)-methyltransferase